jgi:hypothetical protein
MALALSEGIHSLESTDSLGPTDTLASGSPGSRRAPAPITDYQLPTTTVVIYCQRFDPHPALLRGY